jgi:1-acyl-sn-glycerol-3-phosphate acyltransferase
VLRPFYLLLFKLFGWKIEGVFPPGIKKYIVAVAPHTSNVDFMIGVAVRSIMRMQNARFLAKSSLFKGAFGWVFKALGGYPVDRKKNTDMVGQVAEIFAKEENFIVAIAPEGTRQKVEKLKTGFYYIAKQAKVPIVPCGFDYKKKIVFIGSPFYASENIGLDIETLTSFFRNISGKNPERGIS